MYNKTEARSIEEYIDLAPPQQKARLTEIRQCIHSSIPNIEEKISYDMPTFLYRGKILLYVAAQKKHIGLYALPDTNQFFAEALKIYRTGKGSIQFPNNAVLPLELISQIIAFRKKSIDNKQDPKA